MRQRLIAIIAACLLPSAGGLAAQETVFYKCTDAQGNTSMQNGTPCAPGMKQEIRRIGEVKTVPVPTKRAQAATPPPEPPQYGEFVMISGPAAQRKPAPAAAALPAPPALYQCKTWEGESYYGEEAMPAPRCAPLQVLGIDGSHGLGMGQACEMKQDSCIAIPEEQLCAAWYRRLDEAEFKLRYANEATRRERQNKVAAIDTAIKASRCATSTPTQAAVP